MFRQRFAKGRTAPRTGGMNRLESSYYQQLELRRLAGEVLWFRYEGLKLRLADGAFFTPDFFLMLADGTLEVHETKGFMREAANVRLKVAAELYPFRFVLVRHSKSTGWEFTEI